MKGLIIITSVVVVIVSGEQCYERNQKACGSYPAQCRRSFFRSYDGSCNNLFNPSWGSANREYNRLIPSSYSDGVHAFPRSITGEPLMNPRDISLNVFPDVVAKDPEWKLMTMQWGQVLAHDMSLTKGVPQTNVDAINCCTNGEPIPPRSATNPRCAPIPLPEDDPYNAPEGNTCINFVRTINNLENNCTVPGRTIQPLSAVTSYVDLSLVYGNNEKRAHEIRTHVGGRLESVERNGQSWLPQDPNATFACDNLRNAHEACYYAGDVRVNQNPQLSLLQNLLMRYHNLIAHKLCDVINPHWDDERCYQETRRILIAIFQKITFNDFLHIFLGKENVIRNGLWYPNASGYINDYDPNVDAQILNEHATSAFRFYHTEIAGELKKFTNDRCFTGQIRLSDWFNRPSVIEEDNNTCELTYGLASQPQNAVDRYFDDEITQFFFRPLNESLGQDLRAIDIQRSRDHGIGTYVNALRFCGLSDPKTFKDLELYITPARVKYLRRMYRSVFDVELSIGGALETLVKGTLAPPTFLCIMTEQFRRTRLGDRYFFEHGNTDGAFTLPQLNSIRKVTLARCLCDTVKCVKRMQLNAFEKISETNPIVDCSSLPQIDLSLWREKF